MTQEKKLTAAQDIKKRMIIEPGKKELPPALSLFSLEGKTAVITGASSGLGREMAIGLAMAGAEVMLVARKPGPLQELADELNENGYSVAWCSADVSDAEEVKKMVKATMDRFGKIDVLVNNAGTTYRSPIVECPDEEYDRIIAINQRSCWLCQKYVGEEMLKRGKGGSIINIGSGAGHDGKKHSVPYCASKGAMVMLTRGAAIEWAEEGIRANIIMPGTFKTPLFQDCIVKEAAKGNDYVEKQLRRLPIGRFGEPQEIVGACIYLASDNSAFMTGNVMYVDGGGNAQ